MNLRISAGSRHDMNHRYMMLYAYVHLDEFYWLVKEIIPKCPQFRYFHVFELHHNSAIYTLWMYMNVSDLMLCIEMISAHALDVHHDGVFSCGVGAEVPPCCGFHREGDGHISEQHGSCTLQFQWWQNSTVLPCFFPENSYAPKNSHEIANGLNCGIGHIEICNYLSTIFSATMSTMP